MAETSVRTQVQRRWVGSLLIGVAVAIVVTLVLGRGVSLPGGSIAALPAGLLSGWSALALVNIITVLVRLWPMNAEQTRAHATSEDPGHRLAHLVAIVGSVVSLGAVAILIVELRQANGVIVSVLAGLAMLSVVTSWAFIQVNYLLHYARVYYEADPNGDPRGGINFNQAEPPEYTDFAYFSVGLGMTYQVADTNVTRNVIRRIVIAQTLLAYLFGAGILAVAINLVAGL